MRRIVALMAAVTLSACGSGQVNTDPAGEADTDPAGEADTDPAGEADTDPAGQADTESPRQDDTDLTEVSYLVPNPAMTLGHVYAPVATGKGYYEAAGVDVSVGFTTGTPAAIQALATGSADMAMIDTNSLDSAVAEGVTNVRAVCTIMASNIFYLAVSEESGIEDVSELEGKDIGIANVGTGSHINAKLIVEEAGLDAETDVNFVPIQAPAAQLEALNNGDIAALGTFDTFVGTFRSQGADLRLFESEQLRYQWTFLGASDEFIAEHPDAVASTCRANLQATAYTTGCPAAALEIFRQQGHETPDEDDAAIDIMMARAEPGFGAPEEGDGKWGWIPVDEMDELAQTYAELEIIREPISVSEYYTNEFLDEMQFDAESVQAEARSDGGC